MEIVDCVAWEETDEQGGKRANIIFVLRVLGEDWNNGLHYALEEAIYGARLRYTYLFSGLP